MSNVYNLIIIGTGPAGLTASIYASRYRIKHLVVGKEIGGTMALASEIENYPGFEKISGGKLSQKMVNQAKDLGAEIINDNVVGVKDYSSKFKVITEGGRGYEAKALIVATGTQRRKLKVPGEEEYLGRGVSYCATCDAPFFKDKTVAVIGGSNAAVMGAIHLARFAQKVYLIYRKKPLRAEPIWVERVEKETKVEIIYEINITEILGDGTKVTGVRLNNSYRGQAQLSLDGVFVEIGGVPGVELVKSLGIYLDEKGYIKVNPDMFTNVPGVFAAGDVANAAGELQQIVTAASEGAIAAHSVYRFLKEKRR